MTSESSVTLMAELNEVFRSVFEDDELTVTRETTAANIASWDSLTHVMLILTIERTFGMRFSSAEVAMLSNVGELADIIAERRSTR